MTMSVATHDLRPQRRDDHQSAKVGTGLRALSRSGYSLFRFWHRRRALASLYKMDAWLLEDLGFRHDEILWGLNLPLRVNAVPLVQERAARRREAEAEAARQRNTRVKKFVVVHNDKGVNAARLLRDR